MSAIDVPGALPAWEMLLTGMRIKVIPEGHPFEQEPIARRVSREERLVLLTQSELAKLKAELEAFNASSEAQTI